MRARAVLFAALAIVACKKPSAAWTDDAGTDASAVDAEVDAAPVVLPARCVPSIGGATLSETPSDVEIGEAVATPTGFAVGVLRKVGGETVGSVAIVSADTKTVTFADLGAPHGDAPPPRAIAQGADVYAAFFARAAPPPPGQKPKTTRDLSLYKIADGKAVATSIIAEQRDESLAYDVALGEKGGVVAWDEDAIGNERGNIKIAIVSADTKTASPPRIVSPDGSDAELPRVVARKSGGWWLVWAASRLEAPDAGLDPGQEIERPGEKRRFRWLELVALDAAGAPGPVKRLTPNNGHVSMFDLAPRANLTGAPGGEVLDVVARDDEQAIDGAGGRIVRITISGDKVDPPVAIVSESVGRGAPDLLDPVGGGAAWLAFSDTHDRVRLLPLDGTRTPIAPPSAEDALDKARALLVVRATAGADGGGVSTDVLAAFPQEPRGQVRFVTCTR